MASTDSTILGATPGDSAGAHVGGDAGAKVQSAAKGIHGIGEAIRGNVIAAVDSVSGDKEGVHKNEQIANKGAAEIDQGRTTGGSSGAYLGPGSGLGNVGR